MATVFTWETPSYYHHMMRTLHLENTPAKIEQSDESSVAYLASHSDAKVEHALASKWASLSQEKLGQTLRSVVALSLQTDRLKMLDVCQRIVTLDQLKQLTKVTDIIQKAKDDAAILPKPLEHSLIPRSWKLSPGIFNKVAQYVIITLTNAYSINLDRPPTTRWAAQSQWMFFQSSLTGVSWIGTTLLYYFETTRKIALVATAIIASAALLKFVYGKFHIGTPEVLDRSQFRNLNEEVQQGVIEKTIGRKEEIRQVITCLSTRPGQQPLIAILVGEPGVGKTQLVEGVAWEIVHKKAYRLTDKNVFVVNTADLLQTGQWSDSGYSSRLDSLLERIEGYEERVILFFDEAHNAAGKSNDNSDSTEGRGALLQLLKTKLIQRNILCILATTSEEYEALIAPDRAFVERTRRVDLAPMSGEQTKIILQRRMGGNQAIDPNTADTILTIAETHSKFKDRQFPRKATDILREASNYEYGWSPSHLDTALDTLEIERASLVMECRQLRQTGQDWSSKLLQLRAKEDEITQLKARCEKEARTFKRVRELQDLEITYSHKEYTVVHRLTQGKLPDRERATLEKTYLFLQVFLPTLHEQIKVIANQMEEKMPLKVNPELVQTLFHE